jgi:diguanylate cyclase (GGDEF)-like protein/PAS domain S-box-containing protein
MRKRGLAIMIFDTKTLIFTLGIVFVTQVFALSIQYQSSRKNYRGSGWWLIGSGIMALGVLLMPLVNVPSLMFLAMISNPLMILGQIFLYIGIVRFIGKKENLFILAISYVVFSIFYYYFVFINNDIVGRAVVVNATIAIISFLIVSTLFTAKENKYISFSADFLAIVFLIFGSFMSVRLFWALTLRPIQNYLQHPAMLNSGFIVLLVSSTLWTFGFILMINQRLNMESVFDKERFQLVFNTTPDASLITRFTDGLIVDLNDKFSFLTGYSREEIVGKSIRNIDYWKNLEEQHLFLEQLKKQGSCTEFESILQGKNGFEFYANISAKLIYIRNVPHVISITRDISERKKAENQIKDLVSQLEIEKNAAQINSITDSLTGIANRRYFDIMLSSEFYRLKRSGETLSLIMIDVDHFKKFNDHYGHVAGDECLIQIASVLKTIVGRSTDLVARFGGEEFVVILPETDVQGAKLLAEKILFEVENLKIFHAKSETSAYVTISLGVISVKTINIVSPNQIIELADKALYRAKNSGRNQIVVTNNEKAIEYISLF